MEHSDETTLAIFLFGTVLYAMKCSEFQEKSLHYHPQQKKNVKFYNEKSLDMYACQRLSTCSEKTVADHAHIFYFLFTGYLSVNCYLLSLTSLDGIESSRYLQLCTVQNRVEIEFCRTTLSNRRRRRQQRTGRLHENVIEHVFQYN